MSFKEDFFDMLKDGTGPDSWISCAQCDDITEGTRFLLCSEENNSSPMCCGGGMTVGLWTWFNTPRDMLDYLLLCYIPIELCFAEDQPAEVIVGGQSASELLTLPFAERNRALRDAVNALVTELEALQNTEFTFNDIESAVAKHSQALIDADGTVIMRFEFFKDFRAAGAELLRSLSFLDDNRGRVQSILESETVTENDFEFLELMFFQNPVC